MRYRHVFRIKAPLPAVAAFHSRSASMPAITPPPILVRVHQAPAVLEEGDDMDFTLWLGPLPVHWRARIEDVTPTGFVDRQLDGPMGHWVHRHSFVPIDANTTDVVDEVDLGLRLHPIWGPAGLGMALGLPVLFAYRGWRTRRLLQGIAVPPGVESTGDNTSAPAADLPAGTAVAASTGRPRASSLALMGKAASVVALAGAAAVIGLARRRHSRAATTTRPAPDP